MLKFQSLAALFVGLAVGHFVSSPRYVPQKPELPPDFAPEIIHVNLPDPTDISGRRVVAVVPYYGVDSKERQFDYCAESDGIDAWVSIKSKAYGVTYYGRIVTK